MIKRKKSKVKKLEIGNATLEASHNDLLIKYNELLKKHEDSVVIAKQVDEMHYDLKVKHRKLEYDNQVLEFAYEALSSSLENSTTENVVKVNASTSCDLPNEANTTNVSPKLVSHRENELLDQVASLKSSVAKLTRGEFKHKEILFHHARDYGKRGLGSFPEMNKSTKRSPEIKTSFVKEVGSYCQHCHVTGHHTRECLVPIIPFPTLPKNSTTFKNNHFLLSKVKDKVKAKFIGKLTKDDKKGLPKQLWVPKALVLRVLGPKLIWVPKTQP